MRDSKTRSSLSVRRSNVDISTISLVQSFAIKFPNSSFFRSPKVVASMYARTYVRIRIRIYACVRI